MKELTIGVVGGLGHISLVQAACLASVEYRAIDYDTDRTKLEGLSSGHLPFREPGLVEIVAGTTEKGTLRFTSEINDLAGSELIYICVGTPATGDGRADTSQVEAAILEIAAARRSPAVLAIKSTVPVGTARRLSLRLEKASRAESPLSRIRSFWQRARPPKTSCIRHGWSSGQRTRTPPTSLPGFRC